MVGNEYRRTLLGQVFRAKQHPPPIKPVDNSSDQEVRGIIHGFGGAEFPVASKLN
jgi:hypothetical protein